MSYGHLAVSNNGFALCKTKARESIAIIPRLPDNTAAVALRTKTKRKKKKPYTVAAAAIPLARRRRVRSKFHRRPWRNGRGLRVVVDVVPRRNTSGRRLVSPRAREYEYLKTPKRNKIVVGIFS